MAVDGGVWRVATFARLLVLCTLALALDAAGKPLSIPPSQFWDGNDGPWSTFRVEVGNPSQQIRLLPAHDQSSTWTIISEACGANDSECTDSRGRIFERDKSSTWDQFGTYNTNPVLEERVGLKAPGLFGWDDLTLGWVGDNMPTLKNQSIVGITSKDFWVGSLAVNPRPVNFTDYNNPIPSLMDNLFTKTNGPIPSLSWSYTAGAYNMAPKVLGNLVLGGYDTTRFQPNSISFPFGQDISFDFQVAVQSITTSLNSESLLNSEDKIIAYISTMVADIWLPTSVCQKFEKAFGLIWDSKAELYLLDSSLHQTLLERDPSVRFTVGPETSGAAVAINMPYWSLYHTAKLDPTNSSSDRLYFPIKRAANDSQYVLGRTFLQNAHLSVDYHRQVFNLSQALYPSSSTEQNIVAVVPPPKQSSPGAGNGDNDGSEAGSTSSGSLNAGVIAGIAVGVAVVVGVLALTAFMMYRRRKKAANMDKSVGSDIQMLTPSGGDPFKAEMGDGLVNEVAGGMGPELNGDGRCSNEAGGNTNHIHELSGQGQKLAEAEGNTHHIHEMAGQKPDEAGAIARRIHELPGEH
ncbi:acid protease [Lentithecium fluviatile CBS 122367]|uniref:Acid protease n=1 Tax=Lentithecium fluviatile CBS 122367 TaxID=1168545 RepID=A0A6G1IIP1_9PLEO|nr:acid protease [Lentithecium fluviatile CBS 122367]